MQVTVFSKRHCQLCDAIKFELMDLQSEYGFSLREHFIEDDQSLRERAEDRVPFVEMELASGATVRFDFPVKQTELRRRIHAEMRRQTADRQA